VLSCSLANGKARLALKVPTTAKHRLLKVKLTIKLDNQSTTKVATFLIS
jgi:hypothetical protein